MRPARTISAAAMRRPRLLSILTLVTVALAVLAARALNDAVAAAAAAIGLLGLVAIEEAFRTRLFIRTRGELMDVSHQLDQLFLRAPIGMTVIDRTGALLRVNPAFCEMLGYREDELLGRSYLEFTHAEDREPEARRLEARFRTLNSGTELVKRFIDRQGGDLWLLVTVSPVQDRDGVDLLVAQAQDITDRKRAEQALDSERQLLNAFLETTPDQVYFKDLRSRFIRVSNVQATRLGLAGPADAVGKTDFDVFTEAHARQAYADEQEIIRTGKPILNLEECETYPDGREAWVATTKLPLRDSQGEIIGTFGVSTDITTRKLAERLLCESEERWQTMLANSQEIELLVDADGLIAFVSPSVERWLGYAVDELLGAPLQDIVHPEDQQALSAAIEQSVRSKEQPRPRAVWVDHRARHKDGTWHSLESSVVCLRDDPSVAAVLIGSRDVTDRLKLERERARLDLERRVSQRLEAVGQLSAGIAHEINTPMQFVGDSVRFLSDAVEQMLSLTDLYHDLLHTEEMISQQERQRRACEAEQQADLDYLRERIPEAFARTVDGIARVTSIVQAMKRFSHPSSSETAPMDLREAIETTLAVCRNEYKYVADVVLELEALPPVTCNVGEINQVLLNVIVNAAQAIAERVGSSDARGTITIATFLDGDLAVVEISDDGTGIPPELQERIYEPFFTTKPLGAGSGQGLALARTTIEQHGGSITCISEPGRGATFTITLPLDSDVEAVQAA